MSTRLGPKQLPSACGGTDRSLRSASLDGWELRCLVTLGHFFVPVADTAYADNLGIWLHVGEPGVGKE